MSETIEGTKPPSPGEILSEIQSELRNETAQTRLAAIQKLGQHNFSSPAILHILEGLALHDKSKAVRQAARQALSSPAHHYIYSRITDLKRRERQLILGELTDWENRGFIQPDLAEVLRQRYEFDLGPIALETDTPSVRTETGPATIKDSPPTSEPSIPRPGLSQTLLSETSIKIALYLGAFFVVAAAAILAALVEAARLPILLAATALFAAGSVVTRARLPQPSFALFIVFSFLLPTDANVLADLLNLSSKANAVYWFVALAIMALIWGFGTWFYASRLFSLAAFISLAISVVRLGEFFEAELEIHLILLGLVALIGLGGAYLLKRWRSGRFSLPLFLLAQISQLGLLFFALVAIAIRADDLPSVWNLASAFFWLMAMVFYAFSELVSPFVLFPWLAVAVLFPLPLYFTASFDIKALPFAIASWVWGLFLALASDLFRRQKDSKLRRYVFPALLVSLLNLLAGVFVGYVDQITTGFAFCLVTALLYTALHILKPRIYIWTAALLLGLGAYFTFFALPGIEKYEIFIGYQLLGAGLLLLLPDLFLTADFSENRLWRWPLRAIGGFLALSNLALILPFSAQENGNAALIYGISAVFFAAYALMFGKAWLGYLSTASMALAVTFAIQHFELDLWLPILIALAGICYLIGFVLNRTEKGRPWSSMLRYSGLALAGLVSIWAFVTFKDNSGWFLLITALFFGIEMFSQNASLAEAGLGFFLASAVFLLLQEADVGRGYQGLGIALALLGTDLALARSYSGKRILAWIFRGFGALILLLNTLDLLFTSDTSQVAAICFGIYLLFFLAQAFLYRLPILGYGFSLYSVLTLIFAQQAINQGKWMLPVTLLAIVFYALGYFLRKNRPENLEENESGSLSMADTFPWPFVLWTSGLGAGLLASIAAPVQGGLSAAIPAAVTATMVAIEAFDRRNVWLGFPANALYLMAYFILLFELNVDEPQFFSIATAVLGMLMHYLLTRAGSRTGAFVTGMVSQLVLLSTTYIQFLSTERIGFFFAVFFQALVVLAYGVVIRSRSLVITPLAFLVLSVSTVAYGFLQGILTVVLIGCTGLILLLLGILAVMMRDRFKQLGERFSDWSA